MPVTEFEIYLQWIDILQSTLRMDLEFRFH